MPMKPGTLVRISEGHKRAIMRDCMPNTGNFKEDFANVKHVGPFIDINYCMGCSFGHIQEFGECFGITEDLINWTNPIVSPIYGVRDLGPEINVRWLPSYLRYGYEPDELDVIDLSQGCSCYHCQNKPELVMLNPVIHMMIVCEHCGNKRCPHAAYHGHSCTNSNEPEQIGDAKELDFSPCVCGHDYALHNQSLAEYPCKAKSCLCKIFIYHHTKECMQQGEDSVGACICPEIIQTFMTPHEVGELWRSTTNSKRFKLEGKLPQVAYAWHLKDGVWIRNDAEEYLVAYAAYVVENEDGKWNGNGVLFDTAEQAKEHCDNYLRSNGWLIDDTAEHPDHPEQD